VIAVGTSGPSLHNKPSCEASVQPVREMVLYPLVTGSALRSKQAATMASADFCHRIRAPLDALSHSRQHGRSPRVWRTHLPAYACRIYVAAFRARTGLCISWPAHPTAPPLSASCSSGQRFACSFLQIPPRDGHPCRSANTSRVYRGLSPPSEFALPGAPKEKANLISQTSLYLCRRRPTLPHTFAYSTIGPAGLNFRVRDGNGSVPMESQPLYSYLVLPH
jgi:hypothetical protein